MEITLIRLNKDTDSTIGVMYIDGKFQCYTLEDEERDVKIKGETCIPKGTYEVKFREVVSGLTKKYRERYDWFHYHLMLQDVPNFNYVYMHVGNTDEHTDGCLLVGEQQQLNTYKEGKLMSSVPAFERLYKKVGNELESGGKVYITVKDIEING
jgi:hypothetical protein